MNTIFNRKLKAEVLPGADRSIVIDRAIRNSGLLAYLSPEDLQTLIAVLTFVDVSGKCSLSAGVIGQSLNLSENQARKRLNRLCCIRWRGKPLVVKETRREDGKFLSTVYQVMKVDGISLSSDDIRKTGGDEYRSDSRHNGSNRNGSSDDGLKETGVIEETNATKETEGIPVREGKVVQLEYPSPAVKAGSMGVSCYNNINKHTTMKHKAIKDGVHRSLVDAGVSGPIASRLVDEHPAETILRQLRMLPFRNAREPAAMLVKAIREDWCAPSAYVARMKEMSILRKKEDEQYRDRMAQDAHLQSIKRAMSKLSPTGLHDLRARAHREVRDALKGALRGAVPQSLVDAQVKKIISDQALAKKSSGEA